jgi:hypothetical protein
MTWLVWRQQRVQAAITAAVLTAFAVLVIVTGLRMAAQWHSALAACAASSGCSRPGQTLVLGNSAVGFLIIMTLGVPALLGLFLGAPLIARELETGTSQWAWTQSVTRKRWVTGKAGWPLLAAAVWGGAVSALVTWWSGPKNALYLDAFNPGRFDIMGIAPVGYSLFAMALGITAGVVVRRTLPAMAATLALYITVRMLIADLARTHFMTAVTRYFPLTAVSAPAGSNWQLGSGFVGAGGQPITIPQTTTGDVLGTVAGPLPVSVLPAPCRALAGGGSSHSAVRGSPTPPDMRGAASCAQAHHVRAYLTYQPGSRFWAFQGIETAIFVALAAALIAVAVAVISRRDA